PAAARRHRRGAARGRRRDRARPRRRRAEAASWTLNGTTVSFNDTPMSTSAVLYRDLHAAPLTIVRGSGVYLEDDRGRRYLDGNASAGVAGIGHGRGEIAAAIAAAGDSLTFVYGGAFTHPWQERLAAALLSVAPGMAAAYFSSGGSEANETALKL